MKKLSDVYKSIRFAKMDPKHDKPEIGGSKDDEEHYTVGEKEYEQQVKHVKKRAMQEEKKDKYDEGEYDQEGDMAKSDLRSIIANAKRLHDMIDDSANLPEWVQSKITIAEDYVSTVANYMTAEMNEAFKMPPESVAEKMARAHAERRKKSGLPDPSHYLKISAQKKKEIEDMKKEEVKSYVPSPHGTPVPKKPKGEYERKVDKYLKKKYQKEDVELQEGRPSQRHPLEGHEYHKKSNEELIGIAKDAHAAAEAMKGHSTRAENKYRDQANDSATVRYFRQKSGMPDWYKKKYGHVKEETDYLEEGLQQTLRKVVPGYAKKQINDKMDREKFGRRDVDKDENYHRYKKIMDKVKKEEVELDEAGIVGRILSKTINKLHNMNKKTPLPTQSSRREYETPKGMVKNEEVEQLEEKNVPTSPEKWAQAKAQAKAKFDVYPSAYANGFAAKKYKEMGGGWKSVSEENISESRKTEIIKRLVKKKTNIDDKFEPNPIMTKNDGKENN